MVVVVDVVVDVAVDVVVVVVVVGDVLDVRDEETRNDRTFT